MVATEVASLTFDAALLVAFARSTELCSILPVRTKRDETRRQLALLAAQNLLYRARQVIVAKHPKDAIEVRERKLMCFKKSLLRRRRIRPVEPAPLAIERIEKT